MPWTRELGLTLQYKDTLPPISTGPIITEPGQVDNIHVPDVDELMKGHTLPEFIRMYEYVAKNLPMTLVPIAYGFDLAGGTAELVGAENFIMWTFTEREAAHNLIKKFTDTAINGAVGTAKKFGMAMVIGLTSFICRVTMFARNDYDLRSFGMKAIILSAEPPPESMRREIEDAWGCKALSQYGLTEMGLATTIECGVQDGLHVNDADFLIEAINPKTGEHVAEREPSELVFTSLDYQGTPLVRYRSYYLSSFIDPPCEFGLETIGKVGKIQGRLDMMTKVGMGEKVYPLLFDEAVLSVSGVVNYQTIIEREGYKDRLRFEVEFLANKEDARRRIKEALVQVLETKSGLDNDLLEQPIVEMLDPGSLDFVPKAQSIVDRRRLYG